MLISFRVGPVVGFKIYPVLTRANDLPDHVKLFGALVNWLLLGVLTMQTCEFTVNVPSLPLPNLTVTADVYHLSFPEDYWWIKFSGKLHAIWAALPCNSYLSLAQHMAFIC